MRTKGMKHLCCSVDDNSMVVGSKVKALKDKKLQLKYCLYWAG
jgi:hypothetical protein